MVIKANQHIRQRGAGSQPKTRRSLQIWQLYWLAYNIALQPDVGQLLEELKIEAYTWWDMVKGRGRSGPHMNNDVWPGVNALYMFAAPRALEKDIKTGVEKIRQAFPGEGIKLIVQPCQGVY